MFGALKALKLERPVQYWESNLLVDNQAGVWAVYEMAPVHWECAAYKTKVAHFWNVYKLITQITDLEGQLLAVPLPHDVAEAYDAMHQRVGDGDAGQVAHRMLDESEAFVRALCGAAEDGSEGAFETANFRYFVVLRLPLPKDPSTSLLSEVVSRPIAWLSSVAGTNANTINEMDWRRYLRAEEDLNQRLTSILRVARAHPLILQWLQRRPFWRGISEPPLRGGWSPTATIQAAQGGGAQLRFYPTEVDLLLDGHMEVFPRHIKLTQETEDGVMTGYQAVLAVSALPDNTEYPGCEWLYHRVGELPFPVEVSIRWQAVSNLRAREMVRNKLASIGDQADHTVESGADLPLSVQESYQVARELGYELETSKQPILQVSALLVVAHHDLAVLENRVAELKLALAPDIEVQRPAGDQLIGFVETLVGAGRRMRDYTHRWLPAVVAAAGYGCARQLGDQTGYFMAVTGGQNRPVFLDPALAPLMAKSPGMLFTGPLGSGKSYLANNLMVRNIVFNPDFRGIIFDPKGERSHWREAIPEIADQTGIVLFDEDVRWTGAMDPFAIYRGLGDEGRRSAEVLAVDYLAYLSHSHPGDGMYTAILKASEVAARHQRPSMKVALDALGAIASERNVPAQVKEKVEFLQVLSTKPFAHILFGSDPEQGLNLADRLSILQFRGLHLPPATKPLTDYNTHELLSTAVMNASVAFMAAFSLQARHLPKRYLIDEAWAALRTTQGKNQILHLTRTGRSTNNGVWLATQSVNDVDDAIRQFLPIRFVYRVQDPVEASAVLQMLDLEDTEPNRRLLAELHVPAEATGMRECLMQDIAGRLGIIRPMVEFEHWDAAFNTNPTAPQKG